MKRVLILMSDTGGGHRAAAEAIRDAMIKLYGEKEVEVKLVDVFRDYSPFPLKNFPEIYPVLVNSSKGSWALSYKLSNSRRRATMLSRGAYFVFGMEKGLRRMLVENPADVIINVHSLVTRPAMDTLLTLDDRPPFITVVTDLVSTHAFWYDRRNELCLVPTQPAFDRGLASGMSPEQMKITGLPVNPRFMNSLTDKPSARAELDWDADLPAILMVAGGDGMGPVFRTARAINDKHLKCQLIIVAGRNKALKEKLEASEWNQKTIVYPFVTNMPRLMAAADILVTKAGPATIIEACIAGLPMIISDAIPGQETGNVEYVVQNHAGAFAPHPHMVADTLEQWLAGGSQQLTELAGRARQLARPDAVWDIARIAWEYAQKPRIKKDVKPRRRRSPIRRNVRGRL